MVKSPQFTLLNVFCFCYKIPFLLTTSSGYFQYFGVYVALYCFMKLCVIYIIMLKLLKYIYVIIISKLKNLTREKLSLKINNRLKQFFLH